MCLFFLKFFSPLMSRRLKLEISEIQRVCDADKTRYFERVKEREEHLRDEARAVGVAYGEIEV